jgi:Icc-related predicted phosphoesterase
MKNGYLIIGDVHGKVDEYQEIVNNTDLCTIQVGDFGFKIQHDWFLQNIDYKQNLIGVGGFRHMINFGNHDDTLYLDRYYSTGDYCVFGYNLMTVRGAESIDKNKRVEGIDYWSNEELSYTEMKEAIKTYEEYKPKIMVTHECPQSIREYFFGIKEESLTSLGLQEMFEIHQPELWIFGHHHRSKNEVINGTRFICLNELETYQI